MKNLKKLLESKGYYATDSLARQMALLIPNEVDVKASSERDGISSACLVGIPGVGKTFLPETLAKLFNWTYLTYSCNRKTGPEQLKEDINIPQLVKRNAEEAVTPGVIVDAVRAVNNGEKVILVIDEYDKSPEETDDYWLEFLQSGETESSSFGRLKIEKNNFKNLIVFFIMNTVREASEPLMRRFSKFIEIQPPEVPTVRRIVKEAVPNADEMTLEASLSLYSMILEEAGNYKKIATIQEVKNALREDITLKEWGESEQVRMNNLMEHMVKFKEDRQLLKAKLKEFGLVELQDEFRKKEEERFTTEALEQFLVEGAMDQIRDLQTEVAQLKMMIQNGAGRIQDGEVEEAGELQKVAATAPVFEESDVEQEITALGTLTSTSLTIAGSLPKSIYNPTVVPLTKKPKIYEDEQYIFAELELDRKKGKVAQLIHSITRAKATMPTENITYDGFILDKEAYNTIGLLHVMETEGMPPRIYLVSQKPVVTDVQFFRALRNIPTGIRNMTNIAELDANVVSGRKYEEVAQSLDHIYTVSEDNTQIVGNKAGVIVRFDGETSLLKLKVTRAQKIPMENLLHSAVALASDEESVVETKFNGQVKVVKAQELYDIAVQSGNFRLGRSSNEVQTVLVEDRIEGEEVRIFAKNELDEVFGISGNHEAEVFTATSVGMSVADFKKQYAIITYDGENEFKIYNKDDDGDEDSSWCNFNSDYGQSVGTFIQNNRTIEVEGNALVEQAEKLNKEFKKKQSA